MHVSVSCPTSACLPEKGEFPFPCDSGGAPDPPGDSFWGVFPDFFPPERPPRPLKFAPKRCKRARIPELRIQIWSCDLRVRDRPRWRARGPCVLFEADLFPTGGIHKDNPLADSVSSGGAALLGGKFLKKLVFPFWVLVSLLPR